MLYILITISYIISSVYGGCAGSTWKIGQGTSSNKCTYSGDVYKMECTSKDPGSCGMRLDSIPRLGTGTYSATIKAAPGSGTNTAFYLYSYGRNNDKSYAWNEIDIEIMGNQMSGGKTRVWTNVWTGYYQQHGQFVTVNFDASKGYHTYQIKIDGSKIYWKFDYSTKRTFTYTGYSDLKSTINSLDFQAEMSLWGMTDGSWPDMGNLYSNSNSFPIYAYFKSVTLNTASSYTEDDEGNDSNKLSVGAILAIIILSLSFIAAIIFGVWYIRRRRKTINNGSTSINNGDETPIETNKENTGYNMSPIEA